MSEGKVFGALIALGIVVVISIVAFALWFFPVYGVWQQELKGRAELARAEFQRKVVTFEAEAKKNAAIFLAEAEVERAKGVAAANKIIGESLHGNESYLRYLWIQTLHDSDTSVIYVPTEANLPILEANRIKTASK
jgi:regulator of protease activity HflC (stomatin/prohibitin superfamily)